MTELLPTRQAAELRQAITDYVTTAISLADPSVANALDAFLTDERSGIFLGPYLRTRLPFAESAGKTPARTLVPSLPDGFEPYAHQARAFARLSTVPDGHSEEDDRGFRLPQPSIVTTGTGSGKTESFLYPVLDHVARARDAGISGMKALILYPMNALANDQAGRLAEIITENPSYRGISAALYTGEASHTPSTVVTADSLITDREIIRGAVPDVLLTNYKMLDQLLLRRADRTLWEASARSLRYLVLDEFHTYDGAQGTDVGMLLRRLRLVLEGIAPGRVHLAPVATSATLGDGEQASEAMLDFARTVFGTDIGTDAVITETRVDLDGFVGPSRRALGSADDGTNSRTGDLNPIPVDRIHPGTLETAAAGHLRPGAAVDPDALTADVLGALWQSTDEDEPVHRAAERHGLTSRDLLLAHPVVAELLRTTARATSLAELAATLFPRITDDQIARDFTTLLLAALSHERARPLAPRNTFPSLEAHLWLREITRVDRLVQTAPAFRWSDAAPEDSERALPAIYCRHCGRSGWGATTRAVGDDLDLRPDTIRRAAADRNGRFRALILDPTAADEPADNTTVETSRRRYLNLDTETLDKHGPTDGDLDAAVIRVLAFTSLDADEKSTAQTCPACGEDDGIRFLGTSLATLLSVSLTSLFGTPGLDLQEKKALVFTDSVQDAAHRAGFVEARSHSLTLRSLIHGALTSEPAPISSIVQRMLDAARTDEQRYRLLHPTITDSDRLRPYWHQDPERRRGIRKDARERATARVADRLRFDVGLELGLTGQVGRTLLLTGSAVAQVRASDEELDEAAQRALGTSEPMMGVDREGEPGTGADTDSEPGISADTLQARRRWVRGILERMRTHGAISHRWLERFRKDGGPVYRLWGGRPEPDIMPAFPTGRALPQLPSIGRQGARSEFDDATARSGWYTDWTARALQRERGSASTLLRPLFDALVDLGILEALDATGTAPLRSFTLASDRVEAALPAPTAEGAEGAGGARGAGGADAGTPSLVCEECRETVTGTTTALAQLADGPCLRHRCPGRLRPHTITSTYYRQLYQGDMRRVVAREHTSLLTAEDRLDYERSFKTSAETPGSPNVLVATPTLEMGIDIGDLSTVLLASVPRSVASYLQRVGRAGRRSGNALDITFVAGRGRTAGLYYDPLDLLNGTVRAPGAYLSAQEILRRQLFASILDTLAGDDRVTPPTRITPVLASAAPGTFLGHVIEEITRNGAAHVDRFLARFSIGTHSWDGLTAEAADELRAWALPDADGGAVGEPAAGGAAGGPAADGAVGEPAADASSGLIDAIRSAVQQWNASREELRRRRLRIQVNLDRLEAMPATDERVETIETLRAEDLLISAEQEDIGDPQALTEEEREKERRRLRSRAGQIGGEVSALDSAHWIGVLERFGLLPNFTLVDDAVALEATIIWQDEDGTWRHDPVSYKRSGAAALTELAPDAHFYAHGRELVVDAVDIGVDGGNLHPTAFCPDCGLAHQFERGHPPTSCPSCRGTGIADSGQHRDVIDLTRVYSTMSRSRTRIGDSREDRQKVRFEQALSVSFHEAHPVRRWSVADRGFGMALHRGTILTRLNLGKPHQVAERIRIGGEDRTAPGFLICAQCGHHDSDTAGNSPRDHQAWCPLRYEREADNRAALLSRTLRTETVVITLPSAILEDGTGALLTNLKAALQLGIETRFGGSIGNVDVDVIAHPHSASHKALLLSDSIVGGTGYLMELAEADNVWDILVHALRALEGCPCAEEGLAACHRCLLPYVRTDEYESMRRATAIDALQELLREDRPQLGEATWAVEEKQARLGTAVADGSPLEARFRRAFAAAMQSIEGADVAVRGTTVSVRHQGRPFTLTSQVDIAGSRPDFVLTWPGSDIAGIAIFTDGRSFHATASANNAADDAVKRMRLRRAGYLPLAVTHADLDADAARERAAAEGSPGEQEFAPLLVPSMIDAWARNSRADQELVPLLRATPMQLLVDVVRSGSTSRLARLAVELPQLLLNPHGGTMTDIASADAAEAVAAGLLEGRTPPDPTTQMTLAVVQREDQLAAVGEIATGRRRLTLVLDDREDALRCDTFASSWRAWQHLANLAQGDPDGSTLRLTTMSLIEKGIDVGADDARALRGPAAGAPSAAEPSAAEARLSTAPEARPETAPEARLESALAPTAGQEPALGHVPTDTSRASDLRIPEPSELSPDWRASYDDAFTDDERYIVLRASQLQVKPPVLGEEFESGIPIDVAWPDLKVGYVAEPLNRRDVSKFEDAGWRIVGPSPQNVLDALSVTGGASAGQGSTSVGSHGGRSTGEGSASMGTAGGGQA